MQEPLLEDYVECRVEYMADLTPMEDFMKNPYFSYSCKKFLVFLLYNANIEFSCEMVSTWARGVLALCIPN